MVNSLFVLVREGDLKSFSMYPHCHNCYEFVYYYDIYGKSNYEKANDVEYQGINKDFRSLDMKNDAHFDFKPNSYIIYPPDTLHNEIHEQTHYGETPHILAIGFELSGSDLKFDSTLFDTDDDCSIFAIAERIRKEYGTKLNYYSEMLNALLSELLISVRRKQDNTKRNFDFNYVQHYFDEYFMSDIDLNRLARDIGYTPEHFRRIFKENFGSSPKNYIINKRMELAKRLLTTTSLPLTAIAERCGYWNYKHFSMYFIKLIGVSPLRFRRDSCPLKHSEKD